MANPETPPAIHLTGDWLNIYSASGIPVGTQLLITTRGKYTSFLAESATTPAAGVEGVQLYPMRQCIVDEGSVGLWAKASKHEPHTVIIVQIDQNV
jgi:hypothetical protein